MLQYTEPVNVRTLILVAPVPCSPSPENPTPEPQKDTSPEPSPAFVLPELPDTASYIVGPIDPTKLIPVQVQLIGGTTLSCHIPPTIPLAILMHPMFREGCEWGYTETDLEEETYTFPKLLNDIFRMLSGLRFMEEADFCPWTVGFILGELARLAEADGLLALTGLAHYCYLLSFLSPGSWGYPFLRLSWAHEFHQVAMKEYRARIRAYKQQGKSFAEAQRLALAGNE
jgi:hypothetical protein